MDKGNLENNKQDNLKRGNLTLPRHLVKNNAKNVSLMFPGKDKSDSYARYEDDESISVIIN